MTTKIVSCTCPHAYQDSRYGSGRRVGNKVAKSGVIAYRCTVCGREHSTGTGSKK